MSAPILLFSAFGTLLIMGAPITLALALSAAVTYLYVGQELTTLVQIAFSSVNSFPIMALPAFVLAGALMECAGISRRIVTVAEHMVGQMSGGLAITAVLACVFFGAISGSGPATTAAVGMLMIPAMTRRGYKEDYAAAAVATAGGIGIIIPPSIPMVIYGVTAQESITKMFLGGVIPGFLFAFSLIGLHYCFCRGKDLASGLPSFSLRNLFKSLGDGFYAVMAPVVILGGIYSGAFTPTEAAVVAIFYTMIVGIFIYKEMSLPTFMKSLETTVWITGRVLIIMFAAYAFGRLLVQYRIPEVIAKGMLSVSSNHLVIWAMVTVFLLFLGMFMETLAIIMLVTPVLLPVMTTLGVDPIHFGVVLVCCCAIGFSTPPLGENLFVSSGISGVSLERLSIKALPFCAINILCIIIMILFPQIILWLPNL
ncbi:TRAP transporter large permease [Bilophila wadsworthia]|uniref:TRAP transporter large permease n=1 Tax=Bilophila wadsworthia TaxID=35833 RepID=UPI001D0B0DF3|nr:TRAP transporter large permease [Bilophila wadsworthia]MCB8573060.1 TRAP transporter large permease [Bilophila wadsworthia]MCC2716200.1 TRAP transporter large permease [Bilophila wadsworthia]